MREGRHGLRRPRGRPGGERAGQRHHGQRHRRQATVPGDMVFGACSALTMFAVSIPIALASPNAAMLSWLLIPVVSAVAPRLRRRRDIASPGETV